MGPPSPSRDPSIATLLTAALAASLPGIAQGLRMNPDLAAGTLFNPDSAMRLVRLNDIVAAGRPLHAVMRDVSGAGNVLPWSHLVDSLLLLLAAPLAPFAGWPAALHAAALAFGPLGMAALGAAIAWAAAPLAPGQAGRNWLWLGAFAAAVAPVLAGYGMLGVVHHHILLVVVPVAMAGWVLRLLRTPTRDDAAATIALGAWAATGLWLSPESIPFTLMVLGALWTSWFATPPGTPASHRLARILLQAHASFALLAILAWTADPPAPGWAAIEPDRLSLPFLALALGAALAATVAHRSASRAQALLAGIALAAAFLLAFPQFLAGTAGLMRPELAHAFFDDITEMAPLASLDDAARLLLGGAFATAAFLAFARGHPAARIPLLYAAACTAATMALAAAHIRFTAYPAAAGATMLPVVLAAIARSTVAPALQAVARTVTVAILVAAPLLVPAPAAARTRPAPPACRIPEAAALLAPYPGQVVLTPVNDVPALLYATRIRTVGSLYHRNPQGYLRLRAAWAEPPGDTPPLDFRATAATLVLACRNPLAPLAHASGTSLAARLAAGQPPSWLHPLATAGQTVLYQVVP